MKRFVTISSQPMTLIRIILLISLVLHISCNPHRVNTEVSPTVQAGDTYSLPVEGVTPQSRWWESLNDPSLDELVEDALLHNLTLRQARARVEQAIAADKQAVSFLYPEVSGSASEEKEWKGDESRDDTTVAGLALSWEIDLWGRLLSSRRASAHEILASHEDLEAAAVLLSAQVAETYYRLLEQRLQLSLLDRQITVGKTLLELTELRFGYGEASVVDVFQQRQQLASTRSRVPLVKSELRTLENRLAVQLGRQPAEMQLKLADDFPLLPELPMTGLPVDLLRNRPDLRRIFHELVAIDYRIAEAVADRFPKVELSGKALFTDGFSTEDRLLSFLLEAVAPLIDWGRRSAEVDIRRERFREALARYTHAYLTAIEEVENALWQERHQLELLTTMEDQIAIARSNLTETRNRYRQGLTDYLPVLTALQSLQVLEREILSRQRELISIRILLYRALGGSRITDVPYQTAATAAGSKTSHPEGDIK